MPSSNIKITATDRTKQAFKSAKDNVQGLTGAISKAKGALGALISGVAIKRFADFTQELRDQADELGKMAKRLNVSTDILQEWSYGAELAGESVEGFRNNIVKFVRNVGDARNGSTALVDEFELLGVELKKQNGNWKSNEELLMEVADKYRITADSQRKLSSAMILFGRGGRKMVNMLSEGSSKLKLYGLELHKVGGAMTKDVIDTSEEANDSMTFMGKAFTKVTNKILPFFNRKIISTAENFKQLKGIDHTATMTVRRMHERVAELDVEMIKAGRIQQAWNKNMAVTSAFREREVKSINEKIFGMQKEQNLIEARLRWMKKEEEQLLKDIKIEAERVKAIEEGRKKVFTTEKMHHEGRTEMGLKELSQSRKNEAAKIQIKKDQLTEIMEFRRTAEEQERFEIIEEHKRRIAIIEDFYGTEITLAKTKERVIREEAIKTTEKLNALNVAKRDSAISTSKQMIQSMGSHNKSWFQANKALAISETIMSTYMSATKALSIMPPPVGMAFAGTITALGLANLSRIQKETYSGKAMGGNVNRGESYIVGEKGKELFTPYQSGNITPNHELSSGTTNINFNIQANDASGFDELLYRRRGMIVGMINQALNNSGQRGIL